jgi:hypothetical protein
MDGRLACDALLRETRSKIFGRYNMQQRTPPGFGVTENGCSGCSTTRKTSPALNHLAPLSECAWIPPPVVHGSSPWWRHP